MSLTPKPSTPFDLDQGENKSMEELLAQIEVDLDERQSGVNPGTLTDATVVDVDDRDVFLSLPGKLDGRCPRSEFREEPKRGDLITVVVRTSSDDNMVKVSYTEATRRKAWETLKEAKEHNTRLSGKVHQKIAAGYIVDMEGAHLFLPMSQASSKSQGFAALREEDEIEFVILELKEKQHSAVISRRQLLEERNDELWNQLLEKCKVGDVVEGTVAKKVSFGIFVNVEGLEGLLHQSDISWKRFAPFKDRFRVGDPITVKILHLDKENNRLSLGLKQLTEDPWVWAQREMTEGDIVEGRITSLTDYGAFLELKDGLEGLIHVSELTWSKRVKHPRKYLEIDQTVQAQVLSLDFENQRIGLGLRQLQDDPWQTLYEEVQPGDTREGEITSVTKFGAFVRIREDVEGLIHYNDYTWDDKVDRKMLNKGDVVTYKILDIDPDERRISCGIKQLTPSPYEELSRKYSRNEVIEGKISGITSFGLFVDIGDGFEGLVHISRIRLKDGETLEQRFTVGDPVKAILLRIDPEQKKIALSIDAYEKRKEREIIEQYIKNDDQPSTSSLGAFMRKSEEEEE